MKKMASQNVQEQKLGMKFNCCNQMEKKENALLIRSLLTVYYLINPDNKARLFIIKASANKSALITQDMIKKGQQT